MALDAEPGPQRRGQQAAARRRADQSKGSQFDLYRTCGRPLVQYDVDLVVFHRGVKVLLDEGT